MGFNSDFLSPLEEEACPPMNNLLNICANYVVNNLNDTLLINESQRPILLPKEVHQKIFNFIDKRGTDTQHFDNTVVRPLYYNQPPSKLSSVNFRNSPCISSPSLEVILRNTSPSTLIIHNCRNLCPQTFSSLNNSPCLTSLNIGNSVQILPNGEDRLTGPDRLVQFTLWNFVTQDNLYFQRLLEKYQNSLTFLDLSGCEINDFSFIKLFHRLKALVLFNVDLTRGEEGKQFFDNIQLFSKEIRHLDISTSSLATPYSSPNALLSEIVLQFPLLSSLDISGTNLAGSGVAEMSPGAGCCDIAGLNTRVGRPLEYLGLYSTHHDACHRHFIPAGNVAGDRDETQILNACKAFIDRHEVLEKILNDLFHLFRNHAGGAGMLTSLRMILLSMERNPEEKHVQISGSASLFYIVKKELSGDSSILDLHLKQRILRAIVNAMDKHQLDPTMMRNGCLTICHFKIPQDVMFLYEKLVGILLQTLSGGNQHEDFVERIAIYLLNSLACQVEGEQKRLVGQLGAMQKMLELISHRIERAECDDVMEIAWSTMWNVTDETPENCAKFLSCNGMNLFLLCLNKFQNKPELLRNMMGLLGNVAEVVELRRHLMTSEFITVFYDLLDSKQDNIEVSYNAAGVLAHILSDGESQWTIDKPKRDDVRDRMTNNILQWNINSHRNINYRSFTPILKLVEVSHTNECRLWACWALANLTRVYPSKYVPLMELEGGLVYLKTSSIQNSGSEKLIEYAAITINNIEEFQRTGAVALQLDG